MSLEEYEAFDQLCLEGLAFLSRYSQALEPEPQEPNEPPAASTSPSSFDQNTSDDESTSDSSVDGTGSMSTSFMDTEEYLDKPQTYDALLEKLEQLAPRLNRNELEEILDNIRICLPEDDLMLVCKLLQCSCPRTGQETSQCFRCSMNICPVSSPFSSLIG
jgi:hypothetical protein